MEEKWIKFSFVFLILFLGGTSSTFLNIFFFDAKIGNHTDNYSFPNIENTEILDTNSDFCNYDINIMLNDFNLEISSLSFAKENYEQNSNISTSYLELDNAIFNFTIIELTDIQIFYFTITFTEANSWNLSIFFDGNISTFLTNELLLIEPTTIYPTFYPLDNPINYSSSNDSLLYNFSFQSLQNNQLITSFLIFSGNDNKSIDLMNENIHLLRAFEYPLGGSFQTDFNKERQTILEINIFDLSVYAVKTIEKYLITNSSLFYSIAYAYVFLYWNLQNTFLETCGGAVPDFRYFQRISGEFYYPFESIHIRNIGNIIRQFLSIRRTFREQDLFFINQSLDWSLNYLQNADVLQSYRNKEFWWVHDIDNGIKNTDWILNSHTGAVLALLIAKHEGCDIDSELLQNGLDLLLKCFWDFDMGKNRISYAITFQGSQYSFTEKSDNYELLVALDFLMMFDLLENDEQTKVTKFLFYIFQRYLNLEDSYIETLPNKGVLFELSLFFNDNRYFEYYNYAQWFEHYLFSNFIYENNLTFQPVFGSENFIYNIEKDINFNVLNFTLEEYEQIILYNKRLNQVTIFNKSSLNMLQGSLISKDSLLIFYKSLEDISIKPGNNYIHILFIFGQLLILSIITILFILKNKKPEFYYKINFTTKIKEKIKLNNKHISCLNFIFFIGLVVIPISLDLEKYSISLTNSFSLLIRRIVNYPIISQVLIIVSICLIGLFLLSKMIIVLFNKEESIESKNKLLTKIYNINKILAFPFILVLISIFWAMIFNISISQMNLAFILLYLIQIITISFIIKTSNLLPKSESKLSINLPLIHIGVILIIEYLVNYIDILSLLEITNRNYYSNLNIIWKIIFILSLLILIFNFPKIFKKFNFKEKNILLTFLFSIQFLAFTINGLFLLIFPYYYNTMNSIKIILFFTSLFLFVFAFKENLKIYIQGLIDVENTVEREENGNWDFIKKRVSWHKLVNLSIFLLILSLIISLLLFTETLNFHDFNALDIFKGILFLMWILYGAFLFEYYRIISFSKTIGYFTFIIIICSIIYLVTLSNILFLPIFLYTFFIVFIVIFQPNNKNHNINFYKNYIEENKLAISVSMLFIFFTIIFQIIWSFKSPDSIGYFLTARNLIENGVLEITDPLIDVSSGFIRKLFYKVSDTSMKIQYPIGSIYLLAIFMQFGTYWRVLFIAFSAVYTIQMLNLYKNFNKQSPNPLIIILILFNSQLLIQITTGIGIDFVATVISLLAINSLLKFLRNGRRTEIINVIIFTIIIPLIKTSVFIFYIALTLVILIYLYFIDENLKNKFNNFVRKYKVPLIFSCFVILIIGGLIIYFSLSGYLNQFTIIEKFLKPYILPELTLYNFSINFIQILFVYLPIFVEFIIPKKWRNFNDDNVDQKARRIIILPLFLFALIFIFFWNSSNLYPFDIGSRYFLLFGMIFSVFSKIHKYKKALKYCILSYIVISNGLVLFHAASLDYSNQKFSESVNANIQDEAIIVTNYYSKLFPDKSVYLIGIEYAGGDDEIIADITWLLQQNYSLYFIPEGVSSYDRVITENFHLDLILKYDSGWINKIFPKVFGSDLINPAPRLLYLISL